MERIRLVRTLVLAPLVATSLAGCATGGPVASRPIEGPVRLGEIAAVDGPKVRPDRVIEDSRCPADVQCIHAGRLIVRATVLGGGWSKQIDLTLGIPVPVPMARWHWWTLPPCPLMGRPPHHPLLASPSSFRAAVSQSERLL